MNLKPFMRVKTVLILGLSLVFISIFNNVYAQTSSAIASKRAKLEAEIANLEKEAKVLDSNLRKIRTERESLAREIKTIDTEIKRRELEIRRLTLALRKTSLDIASTTKGIEILSQKIDVSRKALASALFIIYSRSQENLLTVFLKRLSFSEFFGALDSLRRVQAKIREILAERREDRERLRQEKARLEDFEVEQRELKSLQEVERRFLAKKHREKDELLKITKGKESIFQELLRNKKKDIATLRTQLFYLEKTGITAEEAVKFAKLAAERTGIRPAFLLALLEVETGRQFEEGVISVGTNVGTGNWRDDMYLCYKRLGKYFARYYGNQSYITKYNNRAEREKNAFFKITQALGFDPDKMPVSKEPPYIGCGGAMGPAQFIPSTWLRYEKRVAKLTGHTPPNPWNVEDAFTASALFLADAGAASKTQAGETRAAKIYLSGNPSCSRYVCRSYASRILSLAEDIERIL